MGGGKTQSPNGDFESMGGRFPNMGSFPGANPVPQGPSTITPMPVLDVASGGAGGSNEAEVAARKAKEEADAQSAAADKRKKDDMDSLTQGKLRGRASSLFFGSGSGNDANVFKRALLGY
jgi:hypothetical protein